MPSWYPYIDWEKSDLKVKVLKPDTPQEIKDEFAKYQEELKKPGSLTPLFTTDLKHSA